MEKMFNTKVADNFGINSFVFQIFFCILYFLTQVSKPKDLVKIPKGFFT